MSAAPEFNFELHQGDTKNLVITVKDPTRTPVSLLGAQSVKWWVARRVTSTTKLLQKTVGSGITMTNASAGIVTIRLDPADTVSVSGDYYHELEVIDSAGDIGTVLRGTMTVVRALVTNPTP